MTRRTATALGLLAWATAGTAEPLCDERSVLTLISTDTSTDRALFALSAPGGDVETWLVNVDARTESARLLPDPLAGLRTGASSGPGPFLSVTECGADCFQPIRLLGDGWEPVGGPIRHASSAAVHLTYDRRGAPWATFHSLSEIEGVVEVTAFRWSGKEWDGRGRLLVQGVGSPAAAPDPIRDAAVLVGSGRFEAGEEASYWIPALPAPAGSPGGQVVALDGAAAYLSFDSRLYTSLDGGTTWFPDAWRPWPDDDEGKGTDYWIDLPAADHERALAALWFDERTAATPRVHLARWSPRRGWSPAVTLEVGGGAMAVDHAVSAASGKWLLLGPCRAEGTSTSLEAWAVEPGAGSARRLPLLLESGGSP